MRKSHLASLLFVCTLLFALILSVSAFATEPESAQDGTPFEIAAKSISPKEKIVLNFKVSVPSDADIPSLSLLLWEELPEDGFTAESEGATVLKPSGYESDSGYYVFCYDGIEDKELGREVYARACYDDGERTVYTETVRYSVALYLYTMRQSAEGEFLATLDALIERGNAARAAALEAGDTDVGPELRGMATITLTDAHFADGTSTGRFLVGQEILAYADQKTQKRVAFWSEGDEPIVHDPSEPLSLAVSGNASYRAHHCDAGLSFSVSEDATPYATVTRYTGDALEVVIPEYFGGYPVAEIGVGAFSDAVTVVHVTLPSSIFKIGERAFSGSTALSEMTLPRTVGEIGASAFAGCTELETLVLPFVGQRADGSGAVHFGHLFGAQGYADNKTFVPESLKSVVILGGAAVASFAFYDCAYLTGIALPESMTSIGESAFAKCRSLETLLLPFVGGSGNASEAGPSTLFGYVFGSSAFTGSSSTKQKYAADEDSVTYYIPNSLRSVTVLGGALHYGAFYGCDRLTEVSLGDKVNAIGDRAFYGCDALLTVAVGTSSAMSSIGAEAFSGCDSLVSVTFCDSRALLRIGAEAFYRCYDLQSVSFGEDCALSSIGESAFYECKSLESIVIPGGVTRIENSAFQGCEALVSVAFGQGSQLSSIGENAFYGASSLLGIALPSSLETIEDSAFAYCSALASVSFGADSRLSSLGRWAFAYCETLTSFTVPSGVTRIGAYALYGGKNLKNVVFAAPSGWYRTGSSGYVGGSEIDVSSSETNATYFKDTYEGSYWYRE